MEEKIKDMDALMVRFLQGTCTREEKATFLSWLNDAGENELAFFQTKEIFDSRRRFSVSGEEVKKTQPAKRDLPKRRPYSWFDRAWVRYAAILAVVFGASSVFYFGENRSPADAAAPVAYAKQMVIHNTRGVYAVTLPDGSRVWLHGATTLTYPDRFSDSIRMVDLQGEAYFAVQSDRRHPFVVQTPTARIRATGTEFNITAYPGDHATTTTLVKGVVDVLPNHREESIRLKPGQQAMIGTGDSRVRVSDVGSDANATNTTGLKIPVIVHEINTELYTDWKDGVYRFKNEPFQNIALRLEKMYGVEIHIEHEELKKAAFSGMFTTDYSLKEVFEIINFSYPVLFTAKDKIITVRNKKN